MFRVRADERTECADEWFAAVKSWKHFSGNTSFPVPHPKHHAVAAYGTTLNKWIGRYGASRRSLARHLAREFKKLL